MNEDVRSKVVSGLAWTYMERVTAQLVSLLVTVVLARLITPEEYGMVAIVTIFTELSNVIVVNGFGTALVQKEHPQKEDYSTVFYASLMITAALYGLLYLFAPMIARFYEMEGLTPVIRVVGLQMPIAAVSSVQQSYISKRMEFKRFFFSTIIGTLISAVVGIVLACWHFGVWALVGQLMTNRIVDTTILSFTSGWRLSRDFSGKAFRGLFAYSWKITASSFLITLYDNIRGLIIGKKYTAGDLAFYNKGRQFPNLISANINTSISKVLFPALSKEQNDKTAVLGMTRRAIKESTFILTPLLVGLAACARPFVLVVLTEKWLPVVPYLQIMCIIYALQPMQTASIQAMKAIGRSDTYLWLEVIKKILNFVILLVSLFAFKDVFVVAVGALAAELVSTVINIPANNVLIQYKLRDQLYDIAIPFAFSVVMCLLVTLCGTLPGKPLLILVFQVGVGATVYLLLSVVFKVESFSYTIKILKGILRRKEK